MVRGYIRYSRPSYSTTFFSVLRSVGHRCALGPYHPRFVGVALVMDRLA